MLLELHLIDGSRVAIAPEAVTAIEDGVEAPGRLAVCSHDAQYYVDTKRHDFDRLVSHLNHLRRTA